MAEGWRRAATAGGAIVLGLAAACGPPHPERLMQVLKTHPGLEKVVDAAGKHRLQVVVGTIDPGGSGDRPVLRQRTFRAGAEYFYPASTVKLFAAVAALERLAELRRETGLEIGIDTPLVYHPLFEGETLEEADESNLDNGAITVRHDVRKLFLVSDNQAYNRLYELVGQDGLAASLTRAGLPDARIVHRLSEARTAEENLWSPRIDFVAGDRVFTLPERRAEPPSPGPLPARIEVGRAYLSRGEKIERPMDFTPKNHVSLVDLQRGLCAVLRPDVDCGGARYDLSAEDRAFLGETMKELPRESSNPVYDPEDYPDDYVKFFLPGLQRVTGGVKIYNKVGLAYGFTTENAYVVDRAGGPNRAFFLTATLYTNKDGVLNDDNYEYDEIALPFLADLAEAVARWLWEENA